VCVRARALASQSLYCVSLTILQYVLGSLAAKNPSALVATLQFKTGVPSDLEIRSPDLPILPSRPYSCSNHGTPTRTPDCCLTSSILTHLAVDKHIFISDPYLSHPVCLHFSRTMDITLLLLQCAQTRSQHPAQNNKTLPAVCRGQTEVLKYVSIKS
jgi:hypothetical protein